jgi:hypothetical protein
MEDYLLRSKLIINEEKWPNSDNPDFHTDYLDLVGSNGIGPNYFCWDIELEPGMHTAEFKTRKTSGEELSYRWSFLITE